MLKNKVDKKEQRKTNLVKELAENKKELDDLIKAYPNDKDTKIALLEWALIEQQAESTHRANIIGTIAEEMEKTVKKWDIST